MKILCTICARGGSKGVPNKNIKELAGKPLIVHTIKQALASDMIDKVIVSTDSKKIAEIARKAGAEVPFIRPLELATDTIGKLPSVQHAAQYAMKQMHFIPDLVVDLDPTSPLRTQKDIKTCLDCIINDKETDVVITGYRSNKNPYFNMIEIRDDGFIELSKNRGRFFSRQTTPVVYAMNASIFIWRTDKLFQDDYLFNDKVKIKIVEMPAERSVDIDSELDFKFIEFLLNQKNL